MKHELQYITIYTEIYIMKHEIQYTTIYTSKLWNMKYNTPQYESTNLSTDIQKLHNCWQKWRFEHKKMLLTEIVVQIPQRVVPLKSLKACFTKTSEKKSFIYCSKIMILGSYLCNLSDSPSGEETKHPTFLTHSSHHHSW